MSPKANWLTLLFIFFLAVIAGWSIWDLGMDWEVSYETLMMPERTKKEKITTSSPPEDIKQPSLDILVKEVTNKDGSVFSFEFLREQKEGYFEVEINITEKKREKLLQTIKLSCMRNPLGMQEIDFFDLDKNGFMDFKIIDCYIGAYNTGDALYLFDPQTSNYTEWSVHTAEYDLENSLVTSCLREGLEGMWCVTYKANEGKLIEIEKRETSMWGGRERIERLINGQMVLVKGDRYDFQGGKCFHIYEELRGEELKPVEIFIYYLDPESEIVVGEFQKFNEKGEMISSYPWRPLDEDCANLTKGTKFESVEDCKRFDSWYEGTGC